MLADAASKKLGISRRKFLAGAGGIAASFVAMNEVFGRFFKVSLEEVFEPAAACRKRSSKDLFVSMIRRTLVRGSKNGGALVGALTRNRTGARHSGFKSNPLQRTSECVGSGRVRRSLDAVEPRPRIDQPLPREWCYALSFIT